MVTHIMPYIIAACGISDPGLVRQNNEDVWAEVPANGFYVLADGMGGHQAGEVAAREAVNALCETVKETLESVREPLSLDDLCLFIEHAIERVNGMVYQLGQKEEELRGMGTTLCCMLFHAHGLVYAHVGDSRIYRLRDKKLKQLTKDHSLLRELVDLGQLSESQATDFLYKNIITKAVGTEPYVKPSVLKTEVVDGDLFMMCSDGLSDLLSKVEIETILNKSGTIEDAAKKLVQLANDKGGHDNVTVVIAKVKEDHAVKDISR
jgi:PPM family protein phosphatase